MFALYWFGYLLWDFLTDMVLGFLIAGGCRAYYLRLVTKLSGNRALAGAIVTVVVAVLIALPTLWLVTSLSRQAASAYEAVSVALADSTVQDSLRGEGWVGRHALKLGRLVGLEYTPEAFRKSSAAAAGAVAGFLSHHLNSLLANVLSALYHFALMLVVVFFGLVDGPAIKPASLRPLPAPGRRRRTHRYDLPQRGRRHPDRQRRGQRAARCTRRARDAGRGFALSLVLGRGHVRVRVPPLLGVHAVSIPATVFLLLHGRLSAGLGFFLFCCSRAC